MENDEESHGSIDLRRAAQFAKHFSSTGINVNNPMQPSPSIDKHHPLSSTKSASLTDLVDSIIVDDEMSISDANETVLTNSSAMSLSSSPSLQINVPKLLMPQTPGSRQSIGFSRSTRRSFLLNGGDATLSARNSEFAMDGLQLSIDTQRTRVADAPINMQHDHSNLSSIEYLKSVAAKLGELDIATDLTSLMHIKRDLDIQLDIQSRPISMKLQRIPSNKSHTPHPTMRKEQREQEKERAAHLRHLMTFVDLERIIFGGAHEENMKRIVRCIVLHILYHITVPSYARKLSRNPINLFLHEIHSVSEQYMHCGEDSFHPFEMSIDQLSAQAMFQVLGNYGNDVEARYVQLWKSTGDNKMSPDRNRALHKFDSFLWRWTGLMEHTIQHSDFHRINIQLWTLSRYLRNCASRVHAAQCASVCMELLLHVQSLVKTQAMVEHGDRISHEYRFDSTVTLATHYLLEIFNFIMDSPVRHPLLQEFFYYAHIDNEQNFNWIKDYAIFIFSCRIDDDDHDNGDESDTSDVVDEESIINISLTERRIRVMRHYQSLMNIFQELEEEYSDNNHQKRERTVDSSQLQQELLDQNREANAMRKFDFLINPVDGVVLYYLTNSENRTIHGIVVEMLKFLEKIFKLSQLPFLHIESYVNTYIRYHFLNFVKLYVSHSRSPRTMERCRLHLNVLLAFSTNKTPQIVKRFHAMKTVKFLAREIDLEYQFYEKMTQKNAMARVEAAKDEALTNVANQNDSVSDSDSDFTCSDSASDNDHDDDDDDDDDSSLALSSPTASRKMHHVPSLLIEESGADDESSHFNQEVSRPKILSLNLGKIGQKTDVGLSLGPSHPFATDNASHVRNSNVDTSSDTSSEGDTPGPTSTIEFGDDGDDENGAQQRQQQRKNIPQLNVSALVGTRNVDNPQSSKRGALVQGEEQGIIIINQSHSARLMITTPRVDESGSDDDSDNDGVNLKFTSPSIPKLKLDGNSNGPMIPQLRLGGSDGTNIVSGDQPEDGYLSGDSSDHLSTPSTPGRAYSKLPSNVREKLKIPALEQNTTHDDQSTSHLNLSLNLQPLLSDQPKDRSDTPKSAVTTTTLNDNSYRSADTDELYDEYDLQDSPAQIWGSNDIGSDCLPSVINRHHQGVRDDDVFNSSPSMFGDDQELFDMERKNRKLYWDADLHASVVALLMSLLITRNHTLERRYTDRYPQNQNMLNIPFLLHHHINYSKNDTIIPLVHQRISNMGLGAIILLRLLCKKLFQPQLYANRKERIGVGAYGTVWRTVLPFTHSSIRTVAVKLLSAPKGIQDICVVHDIFNEILVMEKFRGDHRICRLYDYGVDNENYYIVMKEYKCSLKAWRQNQKTPLQQNMPLYMNVFKKVLECFKFLKDNRVNHFDIKCDNIFIEPFDDVSEREFWHHKTEVPKFEVVVGDFGESYLYANEKDAYSTQHRGTDCIKSPEMLKIEAMNNRSKFYDRRRKVGAGCASDVWSLGCLFFELITSEFLFDASEYGMFYVQLTDESKTLISQERFSKMNYNPMLMDVLAYILVRDPVRRPSIYDLLAKFNDWNRTFPSLQHLKKTLGNDVVSPDVTPRSPPRLATAVPELHVQSQHLGDPDDDDDDIYYDLATPHSTRSHFKGFSNKDPLRKQLLSGRNKSGLQRSNSGNRFHGASGVLANSTKGDSVTTDDNDEHDGVIKFQGSYPWTRNDVAFYNDHETTLIRKRLYLGSEHIACDKRALSQLGITHIVNCCPNQQPKYPDNFLYFNLRYHLNDPECFSEYVRAFVFVRDAIKRRGRVLIYSGKGLSRSALFVVLYLMHCYNLSSYEAYVIVRNRRPTVRPEIVSHFLHFLQNVKTTRPKVITHHAQQFYDVQERLTIPSSLGDFPTGTKGGKHRGTTAIETVALEEHPPSVKKRGRKRGTNDSDSVHWYKCLCGSCVIGVLSPIYIYRLEPDLVEQEPSPLRSWPSFMDEMKQLYFYEPKFINIGFTTSDKVLTDAFDLSEHTELYQPLASTESMFRENGQESMWEVFRCKYCSYMTHAVKDKFVRKIPNSPRHRRDRQEMRHETEINGDNYNDNRPMGQFGCVDGKRQQNVVIPIDMVDVAVNINLRTTELTATNKTQDLRPLLFFRGIQK